MAEGSGYVIELRGEAAGLVVKDGNGFRFYAAEKNFTALERILYRSPAEAEDACRKIAFPGRMPRPQLQDNPPSLADRYIDGGMLPYTRRTVLS